MKVGKPKQTNQFGEDKFAGICPFKNLLVLETRQEFSQTAQIINCNNVDEYPSGPKRC